MLAFSELPGTAASDCCPPLAFFFLFRRGPVLFGPVPLGRDSPLFSLPFGFGRSTLIERFR